ncbi:MAG: hypothetical protein AB1730_15730 [Myxococcota bacterium]|jgi:hypothetical protein
MAADKTSFAWTTALTPAQVREALAQRVQPGALLSFEIGARGDADKPFRGEVGDGTFAIIRRAMGRNSFVPIVRGVVSAAPAGARVEVSMALPRAVLTFISAWTLVAFGAVAWLLWALPVEASLTPVLLFTPLPAIGPLVAWLVFNAEVRRATGMLKGWIPPVRAAASGTGS